MARSTIYNYYAKKEELVTAYMLDKLEHVFAQLDLDRCEISIVDAFSAMHRSPLQDAILIQRVLFASQPEKSNQSISVLNVQIVLTPSNCLINPYLLTMSYPSLCI